MPHSKHENGTISTGEMATLHEYYKLPIQPGGQFLLLLLLHFPLLRDIFIQNAQFPCVNDQIHAK